MTLEEANKYFLDLRKKYSSAFDFVYENDLRNVFSYINHLEQISGFLTETNETKFILEDKTYDNPIELIYALANKGIINLDHDEMEEKGVKIIL